MSVAESTVIFGPMDQLGCFNACSGVTVARSATCRPRKGPPEPVSSSSSTGASRPARGQALEQGAVLAVHGQDERARGACRSQHEGPARHHALLVGQRQLGAGVQRGHGGAQAGGADDAVENREAHTGRGGLGGGLMDELAAAALAAAHQQFGVARRDVGGGALVAQGDAAYAVLERQLREPLAATRGQTRDRDVGHGGQHVQSLATDGAGGAQDDEVLADVGGAGHGGKPTTAALSAGAAARPAPCASRPLAAAGSPCTGRAPRPPGSSDRRTAPDALPLPGGTRGAPGQARCACPGSR